jgi:hypothetical protein
MKLKLLKAFGLLAACAIAAGSIHAQDNRALLDTLVQKGVISQAEADQIRYNSAVVKPASDATRSLTFNGLVQSQFNWISMRDKTPATGNPAATTTFEMRRVYLGATADLGNGWSGTIVANFGTGAAARSYLDEAHISKQVDWDMVQGDVTVGYRKVTFGYEETTNPADIKTVERSIATNFWNLAGFSARHVGLYWDGQIDQVDGLYYGAAVTNDAQNAVGGQFGAVNNDVAWWGNVGYSDSFENVDFDVGFNFGYSPGGNNLGAAQQWEVFGYNPYVNVGYEGFNLMGEMLISNVRNGRVNPVGARSDSTPIGINVIPSYRINEEFEAVFRWSYLHTNGMGTTAAVLGPNAPFVNTSIGQYNSANSFYFGGNWYIMGNDVKLSAGYEYTRFQGTPANWAQGTISNLDANSVQTRLQLLF